MRVSYFQGRKRSLTRPPPWLRALPQCRSHIIRYPISWVTITHIYNTIGGLMQHGKSSSSPEGFRVRWFTAVLHAYTTSRARLIPSWPHRGILADKSLGKRRSWRSDLFNKKAHGHGVRGPESSRELCVSSHVYFNAKTTTKPPNTGCNPNSDSSRCMLDRQFAVAGRDTQP